MLAITGEAAAAILGAVAGGSIALIGQAVFGSLSTLRARRVAAQVIFAELIGNLATVVPAIQGAGWSSTKPAALRAAWDTYGPRLLLPWHRAHDVGAVASAYNRVDDIAWLSTTGAIAPGQDYSPHMDDILDGHLRGRPHRRLLGPGASRAWCARRPCAAEAGEASRQRSRIEASLPTPPRSSRSLASAVTVTSVF